MFTNLFITGCFFMGSQIQLYAGIQKKLNKKQIKKFFIWFGLLMIPFIYAVIASMFEMPIADMIQMAPFLLWMLVFIEAIIYSIIFRKNIIPLINEAMVLSLTISFWVLITLNIREFGWNFLTGSPEIMMGIIIAHFVLGYALYTNQRSNDISKWLLYAWYFFANFIFAGRALFRIIQIVKDVPENISVQEMSYYGISFFLIGMVSVMVLQYALSGIIMMLEDVQVIKHYDDTQLEHRMIKWVVILQLAYLAILLTLLPHFGFHIVLFWVLITPVLVRVLKKFLK